MSPIDEICSRLETFGGAEYGGERISQLEHALQCAALAEASGASDALVTAALLHDIGHLVHDLGSEPAARGVDDRHEAIGTAWLARWLQVPVTEPVRLHVDAKRWLVATDASYAAMLSPVSQRSLVLQGGPFDAAAATRFIAQPHAADAVRLRRWDEGAKIPGRPTPDLAHFRRHLEACLAT